MCVAKGSGATTATTENNRWKLHGPLLVVVRRKLLISMVATKVVATLAAAAATTAAAAAAAATEAAALAATANQQKNRNRNCNMMWWLRMLFMAIALRRMSMLSMVMTTGQKSMLTMKTVMMNITRGDAAAVVL